MSRNISFSNQSGFSNSDRLIFQLSPFRVRGKKAEKFLTI
jgi:hypothetical protein